MACSWTPAKGNKPTILEALPAREKYGIQPTWLTQVSPGRYLVGAILCYSGMSVCVCQSARTRATCSSCPPRLSTAVTGPCAVLGKDISVAALMRHLVPI